MAYFLFDMQLTKVRQKCNPVWLPHPNRIDTCAKQDLFTAGFKGVVQECSLKQIKEEMCKLW